MYILPKIIRKIIGIPAVKKSTLKKGVKIDSFSVVVDAKIGEYSYIGEHSSLICAEIGSYCSISNYCAVGGGSHPTDWVSTSPMFNSSKGILKNKYSNNEYNPHKKTIIYNDVWIGSHCLIKSGVTIGNGAVIGMGSVVTKDIPEYEIWAGNPARFIRKRFDDDIVNQISEIQWWNWEREKIISEANGFNNIESFVERNI